MRYVFAWLALAVAVIVGFGSFNWLSYRRLALRGVRVGATVVELLPKDHNTMRYTYTVGGRSFTGKMQSRAPNPPLEQIQVTQSVVIYYDPEYPEISVAGDPVPILKNETITIALGVLMFPTLLVVVWAAKRTTRSAV